MGGTRYMVIERFRNGDAVPVYRRLREGGRALPEGVTWVSSWVDESLECCYQLMDAAERAQLDTWMATWSDLVEFEVHRVITSEEAMARVADRL